MILSAILFMQEFGLPETSHRQRRSEFIAKNNPIANESLNFESTHTIATHTQTAHVRFAYAARNQNMVSNNALPSCD